ncbi:MAG: hypothetical protein GEV06_14450 [Luteitalea sp.]|nr:hypothetical protein [Luteitalea sp.]
MRKRGRDQLPDRRQLPVRWLIAVLVTVVAISAGACGAERDLAQSIEVTDVTTGFMSVPPQGGQHKIVPAISFRLKNVGPEALGTLQLNAVFRIADDPTDERGSGFIRSVQPDPLEPGRSTEAFTLQAQKGYTGEQQAGEMFQHSQFRDMRVEVFAKFRAQQWQRVAEFTIQRQLLMPAAS